VVYTGTINSTKHFKKRLNISLPGGEHTMNSFTILIEEDFASNNVCAYVPELRLSAVGDTEEETLANVKDLIVLELEKPNVRTFTSKVISLQVEIPSTKLVIPLSSRQ
jgi:predicted RNase H-like HicB family nuclease